MPEADIAAETGPSAADDVDTSRVGTHEPRPIEAEPHAESTSRKLQFE